MSFLRSRKARLESAAESGDCATLQRLLEAGADADASGALAAAAAHGRGGAVELLLRYGADAHAADALARAPPHSSIALALRGALLVSDASAIGCCEVVGGWVLW